VFGRQGSGKGTQCAVLAEKLGVPHISTGDLLREAVRQGTEVGRRVAPVIEGGGLVSDDLMVELVAEQARLDDWEHRGFILDGFPRTVAQAEAFFAAAGVIEDDASSPHPSVGLDAAVELAVPLDDVLDRLQRRRVCPVCGTIVTVDDPSIESAPCPNGHGPAVRRDDDQPDAIRRRLTLYEQETGPLLPWFEERGLLVRVDGTGDRVVVTERLLQALDPILRDT
jgi:adenylate kinase